MSNSLPDGLPSCSTWPAYFSSIGVLDFSCSFFLSSSFFFSSFLSSFLPSSYFLSSFFSFYSGVSPPFCIFTMALRIPPILE
jgi:hypothetical protein